MHMSGSGDFEADVGGDAGLCGGLRAASMEPLGVESYDVGGRRRLRQNDGGSAVAAATSATVPPAVSRACTRVSQRGVQLPRPTWTRRTPLRRMVWRSTVLGRFGRGGL